MRIITKYEANDGALFDEPAKAGQRDALISRCNVINLMLPEPPERSSQRVLHDKKALIEFRRAVVMLCREMFPKDTCFQHPPQDIHPLSYYAGRLVSEAGPACLNRLWYRLCCMDGGYEYQQPFYAINPDKFEGE